MHLTAARNSHVFSLDADFLFKPEFYAFQVRKFKRKLFIQKTYRPGRTTANITNYAKIACPVRMFAKQNRFYKIVLATVQHEIEMINAFKCNNIKKIHYT